MSKRPVHLLALGGLAAALVFASQHSPAQPKKDTPVAKQPAPPTAEKIISVTVENLRNHEYKPKTLPE